jgi:hypothetical protein
MNACELSISPQQVVGQGWAHLVMTLLKPASLPPTDTVTYDAVEVKLESWFCTPETFAPEHATNVSEAPSRAASSTG